MNDETVRLILDMGASGANVEEVTTRLRTLDSELDKAAVSTEKLGSKMAGTGQSLLQGGRVIQDFAQGGLGGILNNIEGLTMALGLGSGLAGVLTVLGVVALTAGPSIRGFFQGLIDGVNEVPKSKDKIEQFTASLKINNEALDEMRKKQSLTNTEVVEFNRLLSTNVQLERQLNAVKEQRQIIEKLNAIKPPGQEERDRERAQNVQGEVGGNQDAITSEVAQGMKDAEARGIEQEMNRLWPAGKAYGDLSPAAQQRYRELVQRQAAHQRGIPEDLVAGAKERVGRAALSGTDKDLRDVLSYLPINSRFRPGLEAETDAGMAKRDAADQAFEAGNERAHDARMTREKKGKAKREDDKKVDALNRQGQDIQEDTFRDMDKNLADDIKFARKVGEEALKQKPREIDLKGIDTRHLPMIPEGASAEQAVETMDKNAREAASDSVKVMSKLVENQSALTAQQRNVMQQLRQAANQIGQELVQSGRSGGSMGAP